MFQKIRKLCDDPKRFGFLMSLTALLVIPFVDDAYNLEVAVSGLAALPFSLAILLFVCYYGEVKDLDYKRVVMGMNLGIMLAVAVLYVKAILSGIAFSSWLFVQAVVTALVLMLLMHLWITRSENRKNEKKLIC